MRQLSILNLLAFVLILATAACQTAPPQTELPPPGTFEPQQRDIPTLVPPQWVPAGEQIALANVEQIAYIGRLDALSTPSTVFAYAFSTDGTRFVGLNNEQIIGWDLLTGHLIFNTGRGDALQVFYSADKNDIYTLDNIGTVSVLEATSGRQKTTLNGHDRFNGQTAYFPDEGLLALGGLDGSVKVWDVAARQSLVTIAAHSLQITNIAFNSDGTLLATSSDDGSIKLWDWRTRTNRVTFNSVAYKLAFAPDSSQIAVGEEQQITLWNTADGTRLHTINTGPRLFSDALEYSPDSQYLVNGGSIPTLTVWDTRTGELVNTLPSAGGEANDVTFSPSGDLLVTSALGGLVSLWDVTQMREELLRRAELNVGTRQILYADWSPDGFLLTLIDATGPVQLWGVAAQPTPTPPA